MRFWDSSAIMPMVYREAGTDESRMLYAADPAMCVWWVTRLECMAVLARWRREDRITEPELSDLRSRLRTLFEDVREIDPTEHLRLRAERLLAVHALRTADALQLAAGLSWSEEHPVGHSFVCFDRRLREAAQREGFEVLPAALQARS